MVMSSIPDLELDGRQFRLTAALRDFIETVEPSIVDVVAGPTELTVMDVVPDVVVTKGVWPHLDPHWKGKVFFTMTAEGSMFEFGSPSIPNGRIVPAGRVFRVDPQELHWLKPDPVVSYSWTGLQWVVPLEQEEAFASSLAAAIGEWNKPGFALPQLDFNLDDAS